MSFIKTLLNKMNISEVSAHCDIPCGIYDPYQAQVAAHTVVRMDDLIAGLDKNSPDYDHKLSRYIATKEEHGELAKHEVRVIWGDFMKPEHAQQFPELQGLVWDIMKAGSGARQTADKQKALDLLAKVQRFAEIFWQIKGKSTKRVPSNFPSGGELVVPE